MGKDGKYWIEKLGLERHPEGGYFRQTYRADIEIAQQALPARFPGARRACTAIYFLLEAGDFSALHRLRSDEVWHFYAGAALLVANYQARDVRREPACGLHAPQVGHLQLGCG